MRHNAGQSDSNMCSHAPLTRSSIRNIQLWTAFALQFALCQHIKILLAMRIHARLALDSLVTRPWVVTPALIALVTKAIRVILQAGKTAQVSD